MQLRNTSLDDRVKDMKLIHCRKCGAPLVTDDAIIERMQDYAHELNEKARKCKDKNKAISYTHEAASVMKMIKGIIHNTTQIEERKTTCQCELGEIVHYIRENNLISDETLDSLREKAREKAKERNKENEMKIKRLYGSFHAMYTPSNNTKRDDTAQKAINNLERGKK